MLCTSADFCERVPSFLGWSLWKLVIDFGGGRFLRVTSAMGTCACTCTHTHILGGGFFLVASASQLIKVTCTAMFMRMTCSVRQCIVSSQNKLKTRNYPLACFFEQRSNRFARLLCFRLIPWLPRLVDDIFPCKSGTLFFFGAHWVVHPLVHFHNNARPKTRIF